MKQYVSVDGYSYSLVELSELNIIEEIKPIYYPSN